MALSHRVRELLGRKKSILIQLDDYLKLIDRRLAPTLLRLAFAFPVVAVTGTRQSGKTTLVRALFADKPYVSLEDPVRFRSALPITTAWR